jgi:hypothetical protein
MSTTTVAYIGWTRELIEKLLTCMITTGCHLKPSKWKECADNFFGSSAQLTEIYRADEKNAIRRIKEKYSMEYKRVCGTLGWRDFAIGNLSAQEIGDLGPIEIRIKLIIQEGHKMGKDAEMVRKIFCKSFASQSSSCE